MPAHLRLIWSADDPPLDAGAGVDGDTFINAREPISSPTSPRSPPPPCGEGKGWGAAQHSGSQSKPTLSIVDNSSIANEATAPHPNPSPQGGGDSPTSRANRPSLPALNRKRSRSGGGGSNGGLSLRKLTALAILIAGLVIAAQALFIPVKAQAAQFLMHRAWTTQLATGEPTPLRQSRQSAPATSPRSRWRTSRDRFVL